MADYPFVPSELTLRVYPKIAQANHGGEEADAANGYPLLTWLEGLYRPLQDVWEIIKDQDDKPGWAVLFDPDATPNAALDYLAQYTGMRLVAGASEQARREAVKSNSNLKRGSLPAIIFETQKTLSGTKTVYFLERQGSAYRFAVNVLRSEVTKEDFLKRVNLVTNSQARANLTTGWTNVGLSGFTANSQSNMDHPDFATLGFAAVPPTPNNYHAFSIGTTAVGTQRAVMPFQAIQGHRYVFSGYLKPNAGVTPSLAMRVTANDGTTVKATGATQTAIAWARDQFEWVADATGTFQLQIFQPNAGSNNTSSFTGILIEDVTQFDLMPNSQGAAPERGVWFDGTINAFASFQGATDASASQYIQYHKLSDRVKIFQKPIGLIMDFDTVFGGTWNILVATHATWNEVVTDRATWNDVVADPSIT